MDYDELTLGAKGHYYPHAVQYQEIVCFCLLLIKTSVVFDD